MALVVGHGSSRCGPMAPQDRHMYMDMCADMYIDADMCVDMCVHMCVDVCRHVCMPPGQADALVPSDMAGHA